MSELIPPKIEESSNESQLHQFRSLNPDSRDVAEPVKVVESKEKVYQKTETELVHEVTETKIKKSTIFGSAFMLTNFCLGTTIFTFAVRAKAFGLVWYLFFVY